MNKRQKEYLSARIDSESTVIQELKAVYKKALEDICKRTKILQKKIDLLTVAADNVEDAQEKERLLSMERSKVYQKKYQDALKKQISNILDKLASDQYDTIEKYLNDCYEEGFLGTMYDIHGQGIPLILPINQENIVHAVTTDSKLSKRLYDSLGENVAELKKKVTSEISRGIATGQSYQQTASSLANRTRIGYNRAIRITRTEGNRIQNTAAMDACKEAEASGAKVYKQWCAALDSRTRPSHAAVDGEIRQLDEQFSNGLMYPLDPAGPASEVINCRCALLQRPEWALGEAELRNLKERAEFFGLDKTKSYEEFKSKYLDVLEKDIVKVGRNDIIISGARIIDPESERARKFAGMYYEEIRSFSTDAKRIAENLGKEESDIRKIKAYLFEDDSLMDLETGERRRFDPDCAIAQSWQRLVTGKNIQKHDRTLIEHELLEMKIKKENPDIEHWKAHELASQKYDYPTEVVEYYGNLKKHRKEK